MPRIIHFLVSLTPLGIFFFEFFRSFKNFDRNIVTRRSCLLPFVVSDSKYRWLSEEANYLQSIPTKFWAIFVSFVFLSLSKSTKAVLELIYS